MFQNVSLRIKLLAVLFLFVAVLIGALSLIYIEFEEITKVEYEKRRAVLEMEINAKELVKDALQHTVLINNNAEAEFLDATADYQEYRDVMQGFPLSDEERRTLVRLDRTYIEMVGLVEETLTSYLEAGVEAAPGATSTQLTLFADIIKLEDELDRILDDELQIIVTERLERERELVFGTLLLSSVTVLLFFALVFTTVINILKRIVHYRRVTQAVAEGDLAQRITDTGTDELARLGKDFNTMADVVFTEKSFSQTVVKSIGDGVIVLDQNMRIKSLNPIAESVSGYSQDEVEGKPYNKFLKFVHDGTDRLNDAFIRKVFIDKKTQHIDENTSLVTKDGNQVPVSDSAAPIFNDDSEVTGAVIVFRDVTKERELEQAKNTFFNIASHQLRTPLGSMRWNLESLLAGDEGKVPKKIHEVLLELQESNTRLIRLVNNLLDISRIEEGRVKDAAETVDVSQLVDEVTKEIKPTVQEAGVDLQVIVDKKIPEITVIKREFRDIIENLLSNAIKYNKDEGKVTLEVVFTGNNLKISVTDTGIGIPEAEQKRIFDRFFRASNTTLRNVQGTGIGLSVVKMFVEKNGGTIWFESEEGIGTVFHVTFPYDKIKKTENT